MKQPSDTLQISQGGENIKRILMHISEWSTFQESECMFLEIFFLLHLQSRIVRLMVIQSQQQVNHPRWSD